MPTTMTTRDAFEREFLEVRAKLLQIAASFDRFDRGGESLADDPRMELIRKGLAVLQSDHEDRAEELQLIFSRAYSNAWPSELGVQTQ